MRRGQKRRSCHALPAKQSVRVTPFGPKPRSCHGKPSFRRDANAVFGQRGARQRDMNEVSGRKGAWRRDTKGVWGQMVIRNRPL